MSQLERHVAAVRSREGMTQALRAIAMGATVVAAGAVVAILLEKFLLWQPDRPAYAWLAGRPLVAVAVAAGMAMVAGIVVGVRRRPSPTVAAARIDEALGTKEKFSTALYLQGNPELARDPFVRATVMDAITTADKVDLAGRFPIRFPRSFTIAVALGLLAFGLGHLREYDLFGRAAKAQFAKVEAEKQEAAKKQIEQVLTQINMAPADIQATEEIQLAKQRLSELAQGNMKDAEAGQRTAAKAQQALSDAQANKERIKNAQAFAKAKNNQKLLASLDDPKDDSPVAEIQREMKKGDMDAAIDKMSELARNFDKMDKAEQEKAAEQMQALAQQMQQNLQNSQQMQQAARQMQQQMQQAGITQQQIQQLQQQMQQAAQGNPQAAQQAQQQIQQMMQQAGANQQQIQQAQQLAQQLQGIQNSQALMQQLQQAAQQMAQGMQQQAQQAGQQQGQQGQQQGQQAGQQGAQQQGGQQQAGQGQQQGGQGQQSGQQQGQQGGMGQGAQQMQDAMEAIKQDMKQMQAAQRQQGQQGGQAGGNGGQQGAGQQGGQGNQGSQQGNAGDWRQGQPNQRGNGMGGPGIGAGGKAEVEEAPFDFKQEISKSKDHDKGQVLAQTLVKADAERGESTAELRDVVRSNLQESTDEVDNQRISRQAQRAVRDYFTGITGTAEPEK